MTGGGAQLPDALIAAGREDAKARRVRPFARLIEELHASPSRPASDRIAVTETARQDLLAIHRHLADEVGRGHAAAFAARLAERGGGLADASDRARPVDLPLDGADIRSILIAPYRMFYEIAAGAVTILAVSAPAALSRR